MIPSVTSIEGQDLPTDCWLHSICPQTEMKKHPASFKGTVGQHIENTKAVVDFKTGITARQNSHHAGFAPIPYTGQKFFSQRGSN